MRQMSKASLISDLFKYTQANIKEPSIELRLISYNNEDYICRFDGTTYFLIMSLKSSISSYYNGESLAKIRSELLWKVYENIYYPVGKRVKIPLDEIVDNPSIYLTDKACPYSIYLKIHGTSFCVVGNKTTAFPLSEAIMEDAGLNLKDVIDTIKNKTLKLSLDVKKARSFLSLNPEISSEARCVLESMQYIKLEDDSIFSSSVLWFKESLMEISEILQSKTFFIIVLNNNDVLVSGSKHIKLKNVKGTSLSFKEVLSENLKLSSQDKIKILKFNAKRSKLFSYSEVFID